MLNLTIDEILLVVGAKEVEIQALRKKVQVLEAQVAQLLKEKEVGELEQPDSQ